LDGIIFCLVVFCMELIWVSFDLDEGVFYLDGVVFCLCCLLRGLKTIPHGNDTPCAIMRISFCFFKPFCWFWIFPCICFGFINPGFFEFPYSSLTATLAMPLEKKLDLRNSFQDQEKSLPKPAF